MKLRANEELEKCKARLVAKGYNQQYGLDYTEVFSSVAKHVTVGLMIIMATIHGWPFTSIGCKQRFSSWFLER